MARTASHVPPARVDTEIREGDTLIDDWQVVEFSGHAYGQIGLWNPRTRALIGGDVVIRTPFGLMMPLRPATPDWAEAKRSIGKAAALNLQTLCVGHGHPIVSGAGESLARFAARLKV
jgi:glyoxylase-like metal-dependent hydrolase (beta-lactamase superfamily II)